MYVIRFLSTFLFYMIFIAIVGFIMTVYQSFDFAFLVADKKLNVWDLTSEEMEELFDELDNSEENDM